MNTIYETSGFADWLENLKDRQGKIRILARIRSAKAGNFGDCEAVGDGISEMRVHSGPGYRVYPRAREVFGFLKMEHLTRARVMGLTSRNLKCVEHISPKKRCGYICCFPAATKNPRNGTFAEPGFCGARYVRADYEQDNHTRVRRGAVSG